MDDGQGARLRQARLAAGFKTAKAAHERYKLAWGDISLSAYRANENGQNPLREGERARSYARSFGTMPEYLLWNERTPNAVIPQMTAHAPTERTADVIAALVRILKPRLPEEDAERVAKAALDLLAGPRESPDRLRERLLMGFADRKLSKGDGDGAD